MKNGWYPNQTLGNPNVPKGANIIGSLVSMSGEVIYTCYSFFYNFYRVCDWKGSKPQKISSSEIIAMEKC